MAVSRVLICAQGFPRRPDDHQAPFLLDHANALAAAGARVTVLCPSAPGLAASERFGAVEVVRFRYAPRRLEVLAYSGAMHRRARGPAALLVPLFLVGFLLAVLRHARNADVVHAHWWVPSGLVVVLAGRLVGVATVVHLHGTDAAMARGPLRPLARWTLRSAGAVLAVSADLARWARDQAGVTAMVAPMPLGGGRTGSEDLSVPPEDGPVLAVGRLVPEKGFDVLIRAVARSGSRLVIVGDGDQREALARLAVEVGARVELVGNVRPDELAARYRGARVVAVPSRREGFGLAAAEAAASGRAVVASDVGGLPEIVRPGVTGALVPPGDVDALARALADLDPALGRAGPGVVAWLRPAPVAQLNLAAHTSARAAVRPAAGPGLVRVAGGCLAVVALASCALAVWRQWDDVRSLQLSWSPGPAGLAVTSVIAANLVLAWSWGWLVRRLGGHLGWATAMRVWWTGQLGRYLPTGLGSLPARVALGARQGVARRPLLVASGAEPAVIAATCGATAALLLPWPLAVAGLGGGLSLTVVVLGRVAGLDLCASAGFVALQEVQVLVRAAGFGALLHLLGPVDQPSLTAVAGAVGLAYLLGFLAVFAPGGVGVREAALVTALAATAGVSAVASAAVVWRLLELTVELPILAWARTLARPAPPPEAQAPA